MNDSLPGPFAARSGEPGVLGAVYRALSRERRRELRLTILLVAAGALGELLTIGIVVPFLAVMAAPKQASSLPVIGPFLGRGDALLIMTLVLAGVAVVAALVRLALSWYSQKLVFRVGHDLGVQIYSRMLHQPYGFYLERNTSEVLAGIEKIQNVIFSTLLPLVQGFVAAVLSVFIVVLLVLINPVVALASAATISVVYLAVSLASRRLLRHNSRVIATMQTQRIKMVQEGLGGIRDILLDRSQSFFVDSFRHLDNELRRAQTVNVFVGNAPRFAVESAGIILIAFLALTLSRGTGGLLPALPTLGAMALGAQRLLPLVQLIYVGWSQYAGSLGMLADVVELVEAPVITAIVPDPTRPRAEFRTSVRFDKVSFCYAKSSDPALKAFDLTIGRGEKIGLVGRTGSGKSTMLDLLMGLLEPTEGAVLVDDIPLSDLNRAEWQDQIAHVPQAIYLADTSIKENIAFGESADRLDFARVRDVAQQAQILDFIEQLPLGFDTRVGDRGVRLSGGQRQRLGIARALYKKASVLILDEATSALDDETEAAFIAELQKVQSDKTIIMIAHRVSTLAHCDRIVQIDDGKIARTGTYSELMQARRDFVSVQGGRS